MRFAALLLAAFVALPSPACAWGFEAHKFIADRMIELLPPELKPLFEKRRAFIVERAIDPDLWRNVGWEEEPPNHFLDMDSRGVRPVSVQRPAARLRRRPCRSSARTFIHEQGLLPWRTAEFYGRLQREFESLKRQAGARLRGRQHRALRGGPRALRVGRSRAAARGGELQRPAHRPGRPALALGIGAVRAQSHRS